MLLDSWPSVSVITWGCLRVSWWPRLLPVFALPTPEECNWFCAHNWAPGNRRSVKRGISVHMSHSNTHTHIYTCTIHTSSYWQLSLYWFVNHNSSMQKKKEKILNDYFWVTSRKIAWSSIGCEADTHNQIWNGQVEQTDADFWIVNCTY